MYTKYLKGNGIKAASAVGLGLLLVLGAANMGRAYEGAPRAGREAPDVGDRLLKFSKDLNLTPDQETQLKQLIKNGKEQRDAIREKYKASREEERKELKAIWDTGKASFEKILTPEQQAKLNEIIKDRREKMKERAEERREKMRGGHDAPPPPPPGEGK